MRMLSIIFSVSLTMARSRAQNVLDSNRFCYTFSKIINFVFVTIFRSKDYGTVGGYTTKWDVLRLIIGLFFGFLFFYDLMSTSLQPQERSIILEITMSFIGKIQGFTPSLIILQVFIFRYDYLKIFMILDWIDRKVKLLKYLIINILSLFFS